MSQFLETLKRYDAALFSKINSQWINSFADDVLPWWRYQHTWLPLYVFLFLFAVINFGVKIWPWIVCVAITITLTDQLSSHVVKEIFDRPRPCHKDAFLVSPVRLLLNYCPGNPGFTSSHATNHFGAAFLFFGTLKPVIKNWGYLFFFWAASISYAQVYVGVHYPSDVIGGAVLGSIIGLLMSYLHNKLIGLPPRKAIEKPVKPAAPNET